MKWGQASKFRSFPGIEPRAIDHPRLFVHKITSPLPDSTSNEGSNLLGRYLLIHLVNFYQQFRLESSSTLQSGPQTSQTPSVDCTDILTVYITTPS